MVIYHYWNINWKTINGHRECNSEKHKVRKYFMYSHLSLAHRLHRTTGIFLSIPLADPDFFLTIPRSFLVIPRVSHRNFSMFHSPSSSKAIRHLCGVFSRFHCLTSTQTRKNHEARGTVFLIIPLPCRFPQPNPGRSQAHECKFWGES